MRIEDFIDVSNKAENVEELFNLYKTAMSSLGFDQLVFSLMTDHKMIDRDAGHGIIVNYAEDWMKYYISKKYDIHDPVRRQMYTAPSTFVWSDIVDLPTLTTLQRRLMAEATDAGLKDGIGIPLRGPLGVIAGIGAASSAGGVELENKNLMSFANLISQQFYTVFLFLESKREKIKSLDRAAILLTDREQEILKWCSRGKTRSEIADTLILSDATVDFHVSNALRKLDASNITLGVLKALHLGLIQL